MKISEIMQHKARCLSFEVFPPKNKGGDLDSVLPVIRDIAALRPDYISVTYGAVGSTSKNTVAVAEAVQAMGIPALAHLTCVSSTREELGNSLDELKRRGIDNVLALRGDIPADFTGFVPEQYRYANELVAYIRERGDFCIGAACYPEGHVECARRSDDLEYLKRKVDAGCDFLTTQMFFDNNVLYSFLYRMMKKGIDIPVNAGVMPITNARHIKRMCALAGTTLPTRFVNMVDVFGDDPASMEQAGIAYATEQIFDLIANGIRCIHVYTMNKPQVAEALWRNLSSLFTAERT